MKTWITTLIGAVAVLQMGAATAGDSPWSLRLGASYRDFDNPSFEASNFRNTGNDSSSSGPFGVQGISTAPGNPLFSQVVLDYVSYSGGSMDLEDRDKMAPVLGWRMELPSSADNMLKLSLVSNFQYYKIDVDGVDSGSTDASGNFTVSQFEHFVIDFDGNLLPGAPLVGTMAGTSFLIRNEFNTDLYVMDFGLEARATMGWFNLTFSVGPTMSVYHAESSQTQEAFWIGQGPGLASGSYADKSSDSRTDILPGAYASVGMVADLSSDWSIGAEVRYDYVHGDINTQHSKLELTSASGIVSVAYRF